MGIYIHGMEMPKDGRKHNALLQFLEDGKCRAIVDYSKAYDDRDVKVFEVVPLPAGHGRLIDADAAVANRNAEMNWAYDLYDLPDYLADCPTIIPAEEEE